MIYHYEMGFKIGDTPIPDPAKWQFEIADLDTEAERDMTGELHRKRVATKINHSLEWKGLEWAMVSTILSAVEPSEFRLTTPDPRNPHNKWSGRYYVGNRSGDALFYLIEREEPAIFTLSFKCIQF